MTSLQNTLDNIALGRFGQNVAITRLDNDYVIITTEDGTRYKINANGQIMNKVGIIVIFNYENVVFERYNSLEGCTLAGLDPQIKSMIEKDGKFPIEMKKDGTRTMYYPTVFGGKKTIVGTGVRTDGQFFTHALTIQPNATEVRNKFLYWGEYGVTVENTGHILGFSKFCGFDYMKSGDRRMTIAFTY